MDLTADGTSADDTPTAQVIPFPRQLRIVPVVDDAPAIARQPATLVEYDGRVYRLADLLGQLTPAERADICGVFSV